MSIRNRAKQITSIAAVCLGLFAVGAPMANATASGTSINGCRAQYFTTAFSTKCVNTTASASYRTAGWCDAQPVVYGAWVYLASGSTANGISANDCTFGVNRAQVYAK